MVTWVSAISRVWVAAPNRHRARLYIEPGYTGEVWSRYTDKRNRLGPLFLAFSLVLKDAVSTYQVEPIC